MKDSGQAVVKPVPMLTIRSNGQKVKTIDFAGGSSTDGGHERRCGKAPRQKRNRW